MFALVLARKVSYGAMGLGFCCVSPLINTKVGASPCTGRSESNYGSVTRQKMALVQFSHQVTGANHAKRKGSPSK